MVGTELSDQEMRNAVYHMLRSKGDKAMPENLQIPCRRCNGLKNH